MPAAPDASRVQPSAFGCITVPFLVLAVLVLAWGARGNWQRGQLGRVGVEVVGEVVELRRVTSNPSVSTNKGSASSAVVRFTTREGQSRTAVSSVNRSPAPWRVGDEVAVVYDPSDVSRADLGSEIDGWALWFAIWCLVALVPLGIAGAPVVLKLRERGSSSAV